MSKGQVTIYVILGLILLIGAFFFLFFVNKTNEDLSEQEKVAAENSGTVDYFVSTCLSSSLRTSVVPFGKKGFMQSASDQILVTNVDELGEVSVSYYVKEGVSLFPSLDAVKTGLGVEVDSQLNDCFEGLSRFEEEGFEVSYSGVSSSIFINENDVSLKSVLDIKMSKGATVFEQSGFQDTLKYDLKAKYDILKDFVDFQVQTPDYFQISKLADLAEENNFIFYTYYVGQDTIIVEVIFEDYKLVGGEPLSVLFALK